MNREPLRILIVDDQVASARLLNTLLELQGYATHVEYDGESALIAAREFVPRVALLDLTLPGMSGIDLAAALRVEPGLSGCRLVAVSGHSEAELPSPSPFDHHFVKPLDFESLTHYLASLGSETDLGLT